jgi:hypothetical protein
LRSNNYTVQEAREGLERAGLEREILKREDFKEFVMGFNQT